MDVYVARQPIFNKNMDIFGYELLYRRSTNNFYEGTDDGEATANVINNAFLVMQFEELTGGTKAFINFSVEMIENEIPHLLPNEKVIVEILETVELTEKVMNACRKLKQKGYTIALDDFAFKESLMPLLEIADIVKIEFNAVPKNIQRTYIKEYGSRIKFLAEKIETREEYQQAIDLGFEYFQGFFFSKPVMMKGKDIKGLNPNIMSIVSELNGAEPNFETITGYIERDIALSFKILKLSNSVFYSSILKFRTIGEAVVRIGIIELKRWVFLLMFGDLKGPENSELVKTCIIRAKFMEILALEMRMGTNKSYEYFLAGIFSSIDVLLNRSMDEIIEELGLPIEVAEALLKVDNDITRTLNEVLAHEKVNWDGWSEINTTTSKKRISKDRLMELYLEALLWTMEMNMHK